MVKLELNNITKSFPGVKALDQVNLEVHGGEIHALCGENGAGKSTLMNILTGNLQPDSGILSLNGKDIRLESPKEAFEKGLAIVYQHLSLVDNLSVAENIFADSLPVNFLGLINYKKLHSDTKTLLDKLELDHINPNTRVFNLSPAEKQMVEIAKVLSKDPSIFILDEPTASLTEKETKILFNILRNLRQENKAIIYISHRLEEIFLLADRISVLKDGVYQGTFPIEEMSEKVLIKKMVGRDLLQLREDSYSTQVILLSVNNLSGDRFQDISFDLHRGEILGLAGLVGAGRTEIARAIFGADPWKSGQIELEGEELPKGHPSKVIPKGIAYVPEDRTSSGLFPLMSVKDNIVSAKISNEWKGEMYNAGKARDIAQESIKRLGIATPSEDQKVINLSGGNQQKVVLAKWLNTHPEVLIVDEPTHGVDVGAKFEIYNILKSLAEQGKGILMISSDMPELIGICDRILVINSGSIAGEVLRQDATEEIILDLASK